MEIELEQSKYTELVNDISEFYDIPQHIALRLLYVLELSVEVYKEGKADE